MCFTYVQVQGFMMKNLTVILTHQLCRNITAPMFGNVTTLENLSYGSIRRWLALYIKTFVNYFFCRKLATRMPEERI